MKMRTFPRSLPTPKESPKRFIFTRSPPETMALYIVVLIHLPIFRVCHYSSAALLVNPPDPSVGHQISYYVFEWRTDLFISATSPTAKYISYLLLVPRD